MQAIRNKQEEEPKSNSSLPSPRKYSSEGTIHMSYEEFDRKITKLVNSAYDAKTSKTAKAKLDELNDLFDGINHSATPKKYREYLYNEKKEVEQIVNDLVFEEWEAQVWDILQRFLDSYHMVMTQDYSFQNVEMSMEEKRNCINLYRKYWAISAPDASAIDRKKYFDDYLNGWNIPCIQSKEELEKRLDSAIEKYKPEIKRKKEIKNKIIEYVYQQESVQRSELLKYEFKGATSKEVRSCYNMLIREYVLIQTKIGSRYFVSLADKTKEKIQHSKNQVF